jgi:hypothetical protein
MNFLVFFLQNIMREEKWGGQLGVASLGWMQPSFFIVCLNQGHSFPKSFPKSFFINFYDSFQIFFFKISWGKRWKGIQGHESPKQSLGLSLPGNYQNLIMMMMKSIMTDDDDY